MTSNITHHVDDEMLVISHYYPTSITQLPLDDPPAPAVVAGEGKTRRRRKKNKGEDGNGSGGGGGGFRKRKLNQEQVNLLEQSFEDEHKLESERKDKLASELGLDSRQVAVWFQNRRARWKSKKLEEEYSRLKSEHDSTVIEKCRLESEVLKLKEQLCGSEKEMQRLLDNSYNSPSSSFSMDTMEIMPPFLGEFGMEGLENVLYVPESNYIIPGLEWANLYI